MDSIETRITDLASWLDENGFGACADAAREWLADRYCGRVDMLRDLVASVEQGWRNVGEPGERPIYDEARQRISAAFAADGSVR